MSFVQPFLRGRVLARRVASVCGMIVVLPLMGCGAQDTLSDGGYSRRDARLAAPQAQKARPARPVLASAGSPYAYAASGGTQQAGRVAETYETVPTSASYQAGAVQRSSLAPLAEPAKPAGDAPTGGYALGAVDYGAPGAGQTVAKSAPVREAQNYARKPQPSSRAQSDYDEADEARRGNYEPEPRYGKGAAQAAGDDYVVQRGDTLYAIAERHGLSLEELTALNGLTGEEIHPGQQLRVGGGQPSGYQGKPYREARPEPYRGPAQERDAYREPARERGAPYRAQQDEPRGAPYRAPKDEPRAAADYRNGQPPAAYVYEPQKPARHDDDAERYEQQPSRPYRSPYAEERPAREQQPPRAYREPNGGGDRPEYTSSNNRYTPDGPFEPSADAPWRGEAEWRRIKPEGGRQQDYQPQLEPRYDGRRAAPAESYGARPPYQAHSVERTPYNGRVQREAERETYAAPPRGGYPGGAPHGAQVYTVQRGDTLYEVARRNGVDQRELAAFNGLPPDAKLIAGQDLRIPQGRGYEGERPRPEANAQQPGPLRQRAQAPVASQAERVPQAERALQAERGPQPERSPAKAVAAAPAQPRAVHQAGHQPQGPRSSKIITDQLPQRTQTRAPASEMVEEAPPAKAPQAPEPQPQQRMAAAPAEHVTDAPPAEAAPATSTAAATAPVPAERSGPRECEALLASPEPRTAKTFRMPVQGMVVAKFGSQADGSFNDGINFSVPKGTPVKAAENGVVAYAGDELAGFGNLVLIRHADGYVTAYAHNDELLVRKCDVVKRGQIISKAGASGKATSPQLHFELRKDSKPMDPDGQFSGT
jgi:murein DD-endopeptidase MepM/ murein hydrolase activator NlpD